MPALATAHAGAGAGAGAGADADADADAGARWQIERLFDAITTCGGGIGKVPGVSLLMAAALGTLCVAAWRDVALPRWLRASGALVAVLLAGLPVPMFRGPKMVPAAAAVSALSLWRLSAGVWVMRPAVNPPVNMLFSAPCACAPRQPPRRGRRA